MDKGGDQMIQETINVVKETEEKAEKIVKDARQQADAMVAKAKEDAKLFKEAQLKSLREDAASKIDRKSVV